MLMFSWKREEKVNECMGERVWYGGEGKKKKRDELINVNNEPMAAKLAAV